ncbi:MAG TPA: TadA family conjugal transfer-associated ATPase [Jiangellaceae bacterium]|nr:TadA family conjugal transfer-associated ATPase [Jiangellaceae bacterium]
MRVDPELVERIRTSLAAASAAPTASQVAAALRAEGAVLGDAGVLDATKRLRAEITGAGPLEGLLREPGVTDVLVNGPADVWVDRGNGLEQIPLRLGDEHDVRRLAQRLAASANRRLDDGMPFVDARLADGVRLHAVLPPISPQGTIICLRVPAGHVFSMDELIGSGSVAPDLAPWLQAIVRSRLAFLVTGGTGTGKTTVLGALLSLADPTERVVLVEDSGELRPSLPHVVRLEARPHNVEGAGRVGLDELVRQALRMRPDRLVVGEVRGREVVDLLSALNTGHEGGCGTLHANSAADLPARLEALGVAAGLDRDAVHAQVAAGLAAVIHLVRDRSGCRRIAEIAVVERAGGGSVVVVPAVRSLAPGEFTEAAAAGRLRSWIAPALV